MKELQILKQKQRIRTNFNIELHDDTKDDKDKEDTNYYNNDDGKFKCKLCLQMVIIKASSIT